MASGQPAESRRVVISVRVSDAEAADIDAARGTAERSAWLRDVALASARPKLAAVKAERGPKACPPHPKRRVNKGLCGACGRNVGGEKVSP